MNVKLKKFRFHIETIEYLAYVIRSRCLDIASNTTDVIRGLQAPTNLTELRLFLALCNVFRKFVPNFARLAAPLNEKLQKDLPPTFGPLNDKETKSMNAPMEALILPSVLALPKFNGHITLERDTFTVQVRRIL